MKPYILSAAVALFASGTAIAADLGAPVPKGPPRTGAAYNWTGFYVGAHVGGVWGDMDFTLTDQNNILPPPFISHDVRGSVAGGQIGFNWQAPGSNWILGIEGQVSWSDADGERAIGNATSALGVATEVAWLGMVTGRVGYAFDRVLVYGKGGIAFAHNDNEFFIEGASGRFRLFSEQARTGWTIGGGIEVALGGNWSLKGEYSFIDFGTEDVRFAGPLNSFAEYDVEQQLHVAKIGVNYRFGR
jgi:outer membrane immunogenic protein